MRSIASLKKRKRRIFISDERDWRFFFLNCFFQAIESIVGASFRYFLAIFLRGSTCTLKNTVT